MSNKNSQKGFTILVAVVTAGILLIVAMTIGGIALKEQVLSIANKDSQVAFYAADTALECALYWDQGVGKGAFIRKSDGGPSDILATGNTLNCSGFTPSVYTPVPDFYTVATAYTFTFKVDKIPVGDPSNGVTTCSIVYLKKDTDYPDGNGGKRTKTDIYAYGYNTCDRSLTRLERGIEAHY